MSLEEQKFVEYGGHGEKLGNFNYPYVCTCDDDDNLLIADMLNNRLQLLHGKRWSKIELQPPPIRPTGAAYDGCALYVMDVHKKQLLKYDVEIVIAKNVCVVM